MKLAYSPNFSENVFGLKLGNNNILLTALGDFKEIITAEILSELFWQSINIRRAIT